MKRLVPLLTPLVAPALVSCGDDEAGGAPPSSGTAMNVEEGVRLEFRMTEATLGTTIVDTMATGDR